MKHKALASALAAAALICAPSSHASPYPVYDAMLATVQYMIDKYHIAEVDVQMAPLGEDVYGRSQGTLIEFNSTLVKNPALLEAHMAEDVAVGWIPGGCSPAQTVAIHESAHVLDYVTGKTAHNEAIAAYGGQVVELSGYSFDQNGVVDLDEALANAMVAVECGTATPLEADLYRMLTT